MDSISDIQVKYNDVCLRLGEIGVQVEALTAEHKMLMAQAHELRKLYQVHNKFAAATAPVEHKAPTP